MRCVAIQLSKIDTPPAPGHPAAVVPTSPRDRVITR